MKKFKGFNPEQQFVLLQKMGYSGPSNPAEMEKFIASNPEAAARLGKYAEIANKKITGPKFAEGGVVDPQAALDTAQQEYATALTSTASTAADEQQAALTKLQNAQSAFNITEVPNASEVTNTAVNDPKQLVTPANVAKVASTPDQVIQPGTGNAGDAPVATATTVDQINQADSPSQVSATTYDATKTADQVRQEADALQAATADPSAKATVRGQLDLLMDDFEGGGTPPWASGAMRQAMGIMQARGLGASSMAGQAIVQAAMESAISIASQDASTHAQFEMQNLNNEQQVAIFKTQATISSMLSDAAADNASKQFNAASENQTKQFMADLESTVSRFNADQVNAITKFNAGEKNAIEQFNASLEAQRETFNAQNDLIIAQANTKWRQDIALTDTAAINNRNMEYARTANSLTARSLDQIWQKERDLMAFAFASSESAEDRKVQLLLQGKAISAEKNAATSKALGYLVGRLFFG